MQILRFPLGTDIGDIDTSFPRIAAGFVDMQAADLVVKANNKGTGNNLVVTLKTTTPVVSTDGETLSPGFSLTHNISLAVTEKYSQASIDKALAKFAQWCGVRGVTMDDVRSNPELLIPLCRGKSGKVKVGIKPETSEFPESNSVKDFVIMR